MNRRSGFTLLELSIVMIIIGLIVGGITVGADMIRAAELNSVIKKMSQFELAFRTFKLKYNAMPGDMDNATDYWGAGTGACTTITAICDGNGNGKIGGTSAEWAAQTEFVAFWKHLEMAEMDELQYEGGSIARRSFPYLGDIRVSVGYRQPLSYAYWSLSDPNLNIPNKHGLYMIANDTSGMWTDGDISGLELYTIESKIDDGTAKNGKILAIDGDNTPGGKNCVISGNYNLSETTHSATCTAMWYFE